MHSSTFGDTPNGRDWCIKALHPSDPAVSITGVPDQSCASTVFVNWQQTTTLVAPAASSGTAQSWGSNIMILPTPSTFGRYTSTTDNGTTTFTSNGAIPNSTLGTTSPAAYASMMDQYERWRLAYMGVTVYLDAPALSNQGSLVAAQYPVEPEACYAGAPVTSGSAYVCPPGRLVLYSTRDLPDYSKLLSMPNAMAGLAKDGCYMPLRLDSNHCKWHSAKDSEFDISGAAASPLGNINTVTVGTTSTASRMYPDATQFAANLTTPTFFGSRLPCFCSNIVGGICLTNLSPSATLTLVFRVGYECMVQPGTSLVSFAKVSPPYDPVAITEYYRLSRELKDAYPAEYNDLGKLWDVVKKAASFVSPVVKLLPGGEAVTRVGSAIKDAVDPLLDKKAETRGDKQPAAALERQLEANHAQASVVRPVRPRGSARKGK